ncbi:MAG: hypothetical protein KBF88_01335 [Polyangiaceae bacterium]|nr:hypothetical protein [Polyangiaceae bacterium]
MKYFTTRNIRAIAVAGIAVTLACQSVEKKQQEANAAQRHADEEKRTAEVELTSAKLRADEDLAKAKEVTSREYATAQGIAYGESGRAQAKANQEQTEADSALYTKRNQLSVNAQKSLDDLTKRTREIEANLTKLVAPQAVAREALENVQDKEAALQNDLKAFSTASAANLDYVKQRVDRGLVDLRKTIEDLETRATERKFDPRATERTP